MQVDESSQRKGLGAFMMNALEAVAKHWNMTKLVLTVLKNNEDAVRFYQRIGYMVDDTSPEDKDVDYQIMSKVML